MAGTESSDVRRANRRFIGRSMRAPMLSRAREMSLARRWRDEADVEALHELVSAYARIVIRVASYYRRYGLPMSDLIQEGLVGMMMAANRFDPDREARFSTYAGWWVRSAMQDFVLRNWSIVRTGTTAAQKTLFFNLRRLRARIEGDPNGPLGRDGRHSIAQELKVDDGAVETMDARLAGHDRSLNARVNQVDDDEWQDLIVDPGPSPEDLAVEMHDAAKRSRWLAQALAELSARERKIVAARRLRDDTVTLERLGRGLGISKERVRQIEHRALAKIKLSVVRQSGAIHGRDMFGH